MERRKEKHLNPVLTLATTITLPLLSFAAEKKEVSKQPNVILILSDDQGYGDAGFVGNPHIHTPELDNLHRESYCFTNFHTGTTSAPTRSGMLTGKYNNSTGVWHTIQGRSIMSLEEYTLAEAFKDNGYATALFGKWHLGDNYPYRPIDRGFDDVLWHKAGGIGQTPDYWGNTYFDDVYFRGEHPEQQTGYCTDVWFSEADRFITQNRKNPFFCFLSLNAPHGPYHVDEKYAAQYRNNQEVISPEFYGMITNIDENIGALRKRLVELQLDHNTVIIYLGDNGTSAGAAIDRAGHVTKGYNGGLRGKKGSPFEGGHRQPLLMHVPGKEAKSIDILTAYMDIMPTLLNLCNLKIEKRIAFDGADMLSNAISNERTLIVDTQREEFLQKGKQYCVMQGDWRLINGKELYNLRIDQAQKHDIANEHPKVVKELQEEYENWWAHTSIRAEEMQYIPVDYPEANQGVILNCHDLHDPQNRPNIWNQVKLRTDNKPAPGFWAIQTEHAGEYTIELYRWPPESNLPLTAPAPIGRPVPNGEAYQKGESISDMKQAVIRLNGQTIRQQSIAPQKEYCITLTEINLPAGKHKLQALFKDEQENEWSAWFIKIEQTGKEYK